MCIGISSEVSKFNLREDHVTPREKQGSGLPRTIVKAYICYSTCRQKRKFSEISENKKDLGGSKRRQLPSLFALTLHSDLTEKRYSEIQAGGCRSSLQPPVSHPIQLLLESKTRALIQPESLLTEHLADKLPLRQFSSYKDFANIKLSDITAARYTCGGLGEFYQIYISIAAALLALHITDSTPLSNYHNSITPRNIMIPIGRRQKGGPEQYANYPSFRQPYSAVRAAPGFERVKCPQCENMPHAFRCEHQLCRHIRPIYTTYIEVCHGIILIIRNGVIIGGENNRVVPFVLPQDTKLESKLLENKLADPQSHLLGRRLLYLYPMPQHDINRVRGATYCLAATESFAVRTGSWDQGPRTHWEDPRAILGVFKNTLSTPLICLLGDEVIVTAEAVQKTSREDSINRQRGFGVRYGIWKDGVRVLVSGEIV